MIIIFGLKPVILPALFLYGKPRYFEGLVAKDIYIFFHIFWIPIIPLWYKKPIYQINDEYFYERKIPFRGWIVNFIVTWIAAFISLLIIGLIFGPLIDSFSSGKVYIHRL